MFSIMLYSPFESSLFVTVFDLFLEDVDLIYDDYYYYFLWLNNNTVNVLTIVFLLPFYIIYVYSKEFENSFFFRNIINPFYKATYGWNS